MTVPLPVPSSASQARDPVAARSAARRLTGKKPPKPLSLTEKVYGLLRTEIITCELEPGRDLSEL